MGKGKPRRYNPLKRNKPHKGDPPDNVHRWFGQYFCGCGNPPEALAALNEVLGIYQPTDDNMFVSLEKLKVFEEKHGEGFALLLLYLLEGAGITQHGGSVYGAWMTTLGRDLKGFVEANPDYEP